VGQGTTRASAEAQRLRELLERLERERELPPVSDDVFVAAGGYPEPVRGAAALRTGSADIRSRQRNFARTVTLERVAVAEAGDLAYVYGTQRSEWDNLEGGHRTIEGAFLQVWRQQAGEWRMEAAVTHPFTDTRR
jgi:ketosteroid isomerase-like protein